MRNHSHTMMLRGAAAAVLGTVLLGPAANAQNQRPTAPPHNEQGRDPVLPTSPFDIGRDPRPIAPDRDLLLWSPFEGGLDLRSRSPSDALHAFDAAAPYGRSPTTALGAGRLDPIDQSTLEPPPSVAPAPSSGTVLLLIAVGAAARRRR